MRNKFLKKLATGILNITWYNPHFTYSSLKKPDVVAKAFSMRFLMRFYPLSWAQNEVND